MSRQTFATWKINFISFRRGEFVVYGAKLDQLAASSPGACLLRANRERRGRRGKDAVLLSHHATRTII